MSLAVGDIVVCIEARGAPELTEGHRYTVARYAEFCIDDQGKPARGGVVLIEVRPISPGQVGWLACRFRKLEGPCERLRVEEMRKEPVPA